MTTQIILAIIAVYLVLGLIGARIAVIQSRKEEARTEMARQRKWEETKKRWYEIDALFAEWVNKGGTLAGLFYAWMDEKGVSRYEIEHIYWEYNSRLDSKGPE